MELLECNLFINQTISDKEIIESFAFFDSFESFAFFDSFESFESFDSLRVLGVLGVL